MSDEARIPYPQRAELHEVDQVHARALELLREANAKGWQFKLYVEEPPDERGLIALHKLGGGWPADDPAQGTARVVDMLLSIALDCADSVAALGPAATDVYNAGILEAWRKRGLLP